MSAINERSNPPLVISNDQDVEKWKETWDGKKESIPDEIHQYMLLKLQEHAVQWEQLAKLSDRQVK